MKVIPLFQGFPGRSDRGFLGWSSCVLLLRSRKAYLFDTLGFNERYELLAALQRHGVEAAEVAAVFLSHFHFDHAVNYRLFPQATLYLHEAELAYARAQFQQDLAVPIEMLGDLEATGRLELLRGERGSVEGFEWLLTPGHTAGLYSLLVEEANGVSALASDAVKNVGELVSGESAMAWSRSASRESIQRILGSARRIVPGHDAPVTILTDAELPSPGDITARGVRLRQDIRTGVKIALAPELQEPDRHWHLVPGKREVD